MFLHVIQCITMMVKGFFVILCGLVISTSSVDPQQPPPCLPDYYWRDFIGIIPEDALIAGFDRNRFPIYVGQVYIKNYELLPAAIYTNGSIKAVTTAHNKVVAANNFMKILCSPNNYNFKWIPTNTSDLQSKFVYHYAVPGGSEIGEALYIGRVIHDGQVVVGKFLKNKGLTVPSSNGRPANYLSFELLTYACQDNYPLVICRPYY